jgi:hypothetical protein
VLTAGCLIGDRDFSIPTLTTTPVPPTTRIPSPPDQPSGYWIDIDHIGDKQVGDNFTIIARTNLSIGEEILVQIYPSDFNPGGSGHPFSGETGQIKVKFGSDGNNFTSFNISLSDWYPFTYSVYEVAINENATSYRKFNVTENNNSTP